MTSMFVVFLAWGLPAACRHDLPRSSFPSHGETVRGLALENPINDNSLRHLSPATGILEPLYGIAGSSLVAQAAACAGLSHAAPPDLLLWWCRETSPTAKQLAILLVCRPDIPHAPPRQGCVSPRSAWLIWPDSGIPVGETHGPSTFPCASRPSVGISNYSSQWRSSSQATMSHRPGSGH